MFKVVGNVECLKNRVQCWLFCVPSFPELVYIFVLCPTHLQETHFIGLGAKQNFKKAKRETSVNHVKVTRKQFKLHSRRETKKK